MRKAALARFAGEWPTSGERRITAVPRDHFQVKRTHVARLMHEMALQGQCPGRRPRTTPSAPADPRAPNLVPGLTMVRPAHVWGSAITDVGVHHGCVSCAVLREV
jgi:hypothetical protein